MEKTVVILRHGKSRHGPQYSSDFERPLAPRGKKAAQRMGNYLVEIGLIPDLIVCSPAKRALGTARRVGKKIGTCPVQIDPEIYSGDYSDILAAIRGLGDEINVVLVVGHNPTLEILADYLGGTTDSLMKTCSMAVLNAGPSSWKRVNPASFSLVNLVHPRDLD